MRRFVFFILLAYLGPFSANGQKKYRITYKWTDSVEMSSFFKLSTQFEGKDAAGRYLEQLPQLLAEKGYWSASIDSVYLDSTYGEARVFAGPKFYLQLTGMNDSARLVAAQMKADKELLRRSKDAGKSPPAYPRAMLDYLQDRGYPFATVQWDSVMFMNDTMRAFLLLQQGPYYTLDSIVQLGSAKLKAAFLYRYLQMFKGMPYNQALINAADQRLNELTFVSTQNSSHVSLYGSGAVLAVQLEPKRSNIINVLLGAMPSSTQTPGNKLQVTADVNILLRNIFGGAEVLGINWQQIQYKSPRINLLYQQPYLWGTKAGMDVAFDLLKKDTQFLNISLKAGVPFELDARRKANVFYQLQQHNVSEVDTLYILANRRLPDIADISLNSLGVAFEQNTLDFTPNPRSGFWFAGRAWGGLKRLKRSPAVSNLKDPVDPGYNFNQLYDSAGDRTYAIKMMLTLAKYWPIGKNTVFKAGLNGGILQSGNYFRNELFQIGGFRLLRGFDEESIYARAYGTVTGELRFIASRLSYFYAFTDGGWAQYKDQLVSISHTYLGMGLGLALQAKNSQVNISWAVGKRNDLALDLRQSKIHLGFVNFF